MINQGFPNQRLLPNPGLAGRFPGQAPIGAEDQMWLQPRTGPFAVKPAPDVQLLQNQQLYNNNVAFKPNTLQTNLQYVQDADFGRQNSGFLQHQATQAPLGQFNAGPNVQGLLSNAGTPNWQSVQQGNLQQQQQQPQAFNNQLFLQQQQQQQLNQLTAGLNAANMQARNVQMPHAGQLGMQGQFVNGNTGFIGGGMKPGVLPQQRMAMPMQQATRLPANRPAAQVQLGGMGNGFGGVGNQGMVGGNVGMVSQMNAMMGNAGMNAGMPASVAMRQQQLHRASFQQVPATSLAFQAPMTTTSMMMDNQAALLRMQQQQHHHQQQAAALQQQQKAADFGMLAADQRGLAAGISMADVNGYGAPLRAAPARVPAHLAQQAQSMMGAHGGIGGMGHLPAHNFAAVPRRYDAPVSLAPNGIPAAALAAHLPNGGAPGGVGHNPIGRPLGHQTHFRAAPAMDALHAGIGGGGVGALNGVAAAPGAGRASPTTALGGHAPAAFAPPKMLITDAQVAEGMVAAEAVAKGGPLMESMEVYRCVGETFARMGITVDQALEKGLLSHMNPSQINAVRDACATELGKMSVGAQMSTRRSPPPAAADAAAAQQRGLLHQPHQQLQAVAALQQPVGQPGGAAPVSAAFAAAPVVPAPAPGNGVIGPVQPPQAVAEAAAPAGVPQVQPVQQDAVVAPPTPGQQPPVAKEVAPAAPAAANGAAATADAKQGQGQGDAAVDGNGAAAPAPAEATGVFDAFGYGFFACTPVDGADGDGLLEALEPDGGLGDELEGELPVGDEVLAKEVDDADDEEGEGAGDKNPEWSSGGSVAGELSGQSSRGEVLSAKLSHLDLGVGFA